MQAHQKRLFWLLFLLLLVLAAPWLISTFLSDNESQWTGSWTVYYFYENDSSLLYTGTMTIAENDSMLVHLKIKPPKSSRFESIVANVSDHTAGMLEGKIIHRRYKIDGGHPTEIFNWQLDQIDRFRGSGQCLQFCAEGTEDLAITWFGERNQQPL